jgi:hypothetical protein
LVEVPGLVTARVIPTVEVVTDLAGAVFSRIEQGYGRRFADHFKDVFREVHRYLQPALDRLPANREGQRLGKWKKLYVDQIRRETVLGLLGAMSVGEDELKRWLLDSGGVAPVA